MSEIRPLLGFGTRPGAIKMAAVRSSATSFRMRCRAYAEKNLAWDRHLDKMTAVYRRPLGTS